MIYSSLSLLAAPSGRTSQLLTHTTQVIPLLFIYHSDLGGC